MKRTVLITALVALALALLPALASAASYDVNVYADSADAAVGDGVCDADAATTGAQCSLRAAIETANASAEADEIGFSLVSGSFTLEIGSQLEITNPVSILGCGTLASAPCTGLRAPNTSINAFVVKADDVEIDNMAITNTAAAIRLESGFSGLVVRGNWLGSTLAGAVVANGFGVDLRGNASTIGGTGGPGDRNVITNNGSGVRILGGDANKVLGNYIGVKADGTTLASNSPDVLVASTPSDPAEGNVIGGTVSAAAAASTECDDACNVIAYNSGWGVNLHGLVPPQETPAVGTIVRGNFIGMNATGTVARGNGTGIEVTNAEGSLIGGPGADERNYITGGFTGIAVSSTTSTTPPVVTGNFIGLNSAGTAPLSPPSTQGIGTNAGSGHPLTVSGNRIVGSAGTGILVSGTGVTVTENTIGLGAGGQDLTGNAYGVRVQSSGTASPRQGNTIAGNTIDNATTAGIYIEKSAATTVTGNRIGVGAGHGANGPGIKIQGEGTQLATVNTIGGPGAEANQIENNAGAGIEISGDGQDGNEIRANSGAANTKQFIDLAPPAGPGNDAATGPNAGIQAPALLGAGESFASGTAAKGSTVRVFISNSAAGQVPTGLGALVGTATTDAAGRWSVTYGSPAAPGTVVTAMQTDTAGNSSELSPGAGIDQSAPAEPQIVSGPGNLTNEASPLFVFSGETGAFFRCAIDGAAPVACDGGSFTPAALGEGVHVFHLSQVDAAGNPGPELLREFTVDLTPPAAPQITSGPSGRTSQAAPSFAFSGETGAGFSCSIDGDAPVACDGGQFTAAPLTDGVHSFQVSQTDGAGNAGPEATREFTVDTTAPAAPQITAGPAGLTIEAAPTFAFSGEAGAGFSCAIDGDAPVACDAGSFHVATLADGKHSFRVLQTDSAGNAGPEATREFTVDTTAPAAPQITAGPTDQTSEVSPTFAFVGERQASFRCAFDGGAPVACDGGSFTPAAPLADGKHSFRVSQTDAAGNAGPEATREFTVGAGSNGGGPPPVVTPRDTTPPDTKIKGPKRVRKPIAKFKLSSTEVGSKFQCKLDRKRFRPCRPKLKAKKLKRGKHVLKVRAVDAAGNVDPTPAKKVFRVGH